MNRLHLVVPICLAIGLLGFAGGLAAQTADTSCVACHGNADMFEGEQLAIVDHLKDDIHNDSGLSCHDCHGGNPDPSLAEDMDAAMDPEYPEKPYVGAPSAEQIPGFCGSCHSDPTYMRRYKPDARVDQEREYWTSQHGIALKGGDAKVATCIGCHGVHGIQSVEDTESRVYPTRVAETCNQCHGDTEIMAGYLLPDGRPIPTDQFARWNLSVHAASMFERGDLSAPTCNDCHGNHGAMPPGLESIGFVCGQCHGRETEIFRTSGKRQGFQNHIEFLADAGDAGCAACHDLSEQQLSNIGPHPFSECASCHGNHAVLRPTMGILEPLPETPCAFCHIDTNENAQNDVIFADISAEKYEQRLTEVLQQADAEGVSDPELRYDWLVDQAMILPEHTATGGEGEDRVMRREFANLFAKFRIGKIHFSYTHPATGEEIQQSVIRCGDCHATDPGQEENSRGLAVSSEIVHRMQELTTMTARAERTLLAARRGGVETREALADLELAVNSQIQLEVLVHTFSVEEDGDFLQKHGEGMEQAHAALESGREALEELTFRRKGLQVSLIFIVFVLIALGLKIRHIGTS